MRASQSSAGVFEKNALETAEDTEKVAKKFEALLIHNMLKAMRSTTLGEKPSNERAMYNDMFDQQLSKTLSESGGLGIASSISRQLNAQNGIETNPSQGPSSGQLQGPSPQQLTQVKQNIQALSNHQSTLQKNGQLTSALSNISQYQALMSRTEPVHQQTLSNQGAIGVNRLQSPEYVSQLSSNDAKKQFISSLMPDAKRSAARLGVHPDVVITIAALETGWGKHVIKDTNGASSNNLFGIKAHGMNAPFTMHKTTEFVDNKPTTVDAAFRRYSDTATSVADFADFLLTNPRYEKALGASADNTAFLKELQRAGYATDPEYANKAINVLQQIESIRQSPAL